jgi:hypothetical protein
LLSQEKGIPSDAFRSKEFPRSVLRYIGTICRMAPAQIIGLACGFNKFPRIVADQLKQAKV